MLGESRTLQPPAPGWMSRHGQKRGRKGGRCRWSEPIEYALSEEQPLIPSTPESEQPASDEQPDITRREREVAILVRRGLTNRQIAAELVISVHTVHHHVTNILKKLNLNSREQVASRLSDR